MRSRTSAAYHTLSEVFPMEIRAMARFYAIATRIGGITSPIVFGQLIGTGSRSNLLIEFGIAAVLMVAAAIAELLLGVRAEKRSLEDFATECDNGANRCRAVEEEGRRPAEGPLSRSLCRESLCLVTKARVLLHSLVRRDPCVLMVLGSGKPVERDLSVRAEAEGILPRDATLPRCSVAIETPYAARLMFGKELVNARPRARAKILTPSLQNACGLFRLA